jgi:hypothetical protein
MKNTSKNISNDIVLTWTLNKKVGRFFDKNCNLIDAFEFSYNSQQKTTSPEFGTEILEYLDIVHEYVCKVAIENVNMLLNGSGELVELVSASEQLSEIGNKLTILYSYILETCQDTDKYIYTNKFYGIYSSYIQFKKFFEKG